MNARQRRLARLRQVVAQVTPAQARAMQQAGAVLVDIREPDEIAAGSPPGALRVVRGFLELRIDELAPDPATTVLLLCEGGDRSLLAAEDLRQMGYQDVRSVSGGFTRWKSEGLPFATPRTLDARARERYGRHLAMPEVGEAGQLRLLDSKVLLVGAGGLGSPAALYLAAAGVGTLGIIDDDIVDRSNLQRQILHADDQVGRRKVDSARARLAALNPDVQLQTHPVRLTSANVEALLSGYHVVVDGTDNFATRYLVNDACVKLGIPNVYGAIFRFEGQVSVFWPGAPRAAASDGNGVSAPNRDGASALGGNGTSAGDGNGAPAPGPCYRCLYPQPPPPELAPSCAEAGVLGVLPGLVGTLQAIETVKLLLGIGRPLIGRLLHYDALEQRFDEFELARDPSCAWCSTDRPFPGYVDYEQFCAAAGG